MHECNHYLLSSRLTIHSCIEYCRCRNCAGSCSVTFVTRLADCHRRWGISPRPEVLYSIKLLIHLGNLRFSRWSGGSLRHRLTVSVMIRFESKLSLVSFRIRKSFTHSRAHIQVHAGKKLRIHLLPCFHVRTLLFVTVLYLGICLSAGDICPAALGTDSRMYRH